VDERPPLAIPKQLNVAGNVRRCRSATLLYAMTTSSVNGTDNASNKAKANMQFKGRRPKK
jgi:hypothetical protein